MSAVTTRVRGLAPWQPPRATFALLERVRSVLREYAQYLPLTVRRIFHRPVDAHGYDKTEHAYAQLGEDLNLPPIEYECVRKPKAELGVRVDVIDALVRKARPAVGLGHEPKEGRQKTDLARKMLYSLWIQFETTEARERWQLSILGALAAAGISPSAKDVT